ncbi:hypothetical protein GALMADRAFT_212061 [Galerina marginata CBS 339.88]|uniref:Uncharacterized protein n=1 Tax=Galerina marginata (strain CBS 339.88) TaxID=685588 RepID=A0A067SWW9_GALM3|nr:hypothetical protein GALMADRAFT_212061 [Galerina marginata CBS 339.88]
MGGEVEGLAIEVGASEDGERSVATVPVLVVTGAVSMEIEGGTEATEVVVVVVSVAVLMEVTMAASEAEEMIPEVEVLEGLVEVGLGSTEVVVLEITNQMAMALPNWLEAATEALRQGQRLAEVSEVLVMTSNEKVLAGMKLVMRNGLSIYSCRRNQVSNSTRTTQTLHIAQQRGINSINWCEGVRNSDGLREIEGGNDLENFFQRSQTLMKKLVSTVKD